jgi:aminoglycoside/choline kinase family phosphotransferase
LNRIDAIEQWLTVRFPGERVTLAPASADASFRRYFRASMPSGTYIVMDAPPEHEDCRPFIKVAALLRAASLHAPEVLAQDLDQGFLLLTDLGTTTFLVALDADRARAPELFSDATQALVRWQLASQADTLPPYDAALLRRELNLFPEWYLGRHLGITLTDVERQGLERTCALIIANNLAQPKVYVHRDYMPRNLMLSAPNPGILDFQDAVYGPITYDVASLFKDAFISWDEEQVLDWTIRYWERAKRAGLPVEMDFGTFYRDFEWMGLQRHLKVLGIFARLFYRDGKQGYLDDTPRFLGYARGVAQRYAALEPLLALLDRIENRKVEVGYTF